jgi:hypothetical protein
MKTKQSPRQKKTANPMPTVGNAPPITPDTATQQVAAWRSGGQTSQEQHRHAAKPLPKNGRSDEKRKPREDEASTLAMADITELIPLGVLPEGEPILFTGRKGCMKSAWLYHMIACVTTGKEFAEEVVPLKKGRVLLFNSEKSIEKVIR